MRLNPFVAASVDLGFAALSAFRPWWVPKKHQQTARLVYAGATGVLSAASSPDGKHTPVDTHILPCWTGTDLALSTGDDSSCHRRDANASAGLCSS